METSHTIPAQAFWNDLEFEPAASAAWEERQERPRRNTARLSVATTPRATAVRTISASAWTVSSLRRVLDCVVAACALTLFAPLLCVIAICVRLSSPGPVIFRQERVGKVGELFTIY